MRTIKFRGKQENGQFAYGLLTGQYAKVSYINNGYGDIQISTETVGQFTGLTDKNDKEIYEGDVLKSGREWNELAIVSYDAPQYYPFIDEYYHNGWHIEECEIIGNIHDNPELLGGSK